MKINKCLYVITALLITGSTLFSMTGKEPLGAPKWSEIWSRDSIYYCDAFNEIKKNELLGEGFLKQIILDTISDIAKSNVKMNKSDVSEFLRIFRNKLLWGDNPESLKLAEALLEEELSGWAKKGLWNKPVNLIAQKVFKPKFRFEIEKNSSNYLKALKYSKISLAIIYGILASGSITLLYKLIKSLASKHKKESKNKKLKKIEYFL